MTGSRRGVGAVLFLGLWALTAERPASAQEAADPPFTMTIGARIQLRYTGTDPAETHTFRVPRARLTLGGEAYEHFAYSLQAAFEGTGARLVDGNIRYTYAPALAVWVGQGKAYFGRQFLVSSTNLQFVDRTIVDARFSANRQQGIALLGRLAENRLEYNLALYNGEGMGQTLNSDGHSMVVGRLVFTPWGDYPLAESALDDPEEPHLAIGVSGLRNTHGVDGDAVGITRMNAEAAFKLRRFSLTGEFFREWADPVGGTEFTTDGWYLQGGVLFGSRRQELAGRIAAIAPEAPANSDQVETGIAYSYYFHGHNAKLQTDLRNLHSESSDTDARELRVQLQIVM